MKFSIKLKIHEILVEVLSFNLNLWINWEKWMFFDFEFSQPETYNVCI